VGRTAKCAAQDNHSARGGSATGSDPNGDAPMIYTPCASMASIPSGRPRGARGEARNFEGAEPPLWPSRNQLVGPSSAHALMRV